MTDGNPADVLTEHVPTDCTSTVPSLET